MNDISRFFKNPKTQLDKTAEVIFQYYVNGFSLYNKKNYTNALESLREFLKEIKILKDNSEFLSHNWAEFITVKESESIKLIKSIELRLKKSEEMDILELCPKPPNHDPKHGSIYQNSAKVFKENHQSELHSKPKDNSRISYSSFKSEDYLIHPLKDKYEAIEPTLLNESVKSADILTIEIRAQNLYNSFRVISANSVCLEPPKCDEFFSFVENLDKIIRDVSYNRNFAKIVIIFDEQKNINNSKLYFIPFSDLPSSKYHIDFLLRLFDICTFYPKPIRLYILSVPFEIFKKTYPLSCIHYSSESPLEGTCKNYLSQEPLEFPTLPSVTLKPKPQIDSPIFILSDSHKNESLSDTNIPTETVDMHNNSVKQKVILNYYKPSPNTNTSSPSEQGNTQESENIAKITPTIPHIKKAAEQRLYETAATISTSEQNIEKFRPTITLKNNQLPPTLLSNESLSKIKNYDTSNTPNLTDNIKDSGITNISPFNSMPYKVSKMNQNSQESIPNTLKTQQNTLNSNPEISTPIFSVSPEKTNNSTQKNSARNEQTVIKPVPARETFTPAPIVPNNVKTKIEQSTPIDNKINTSNKNNQTQLNVNQNTNFQVNTNQPAVNACNFESKLSNVTIPTELSKSKLNIEPTRPPIVPIKTATEIPTVDRSTKPVVQSYINDCPKAYQDAYLPIRTTLDPYIVGLDNTNNICYINSIFQSLFSINSFCELIKQAYFIMNMNMPNDNTTPTLIPQLYFLLAEIMTGRYNYLSMQTIQNVIFTRVSYLAQGYQQDAHEFLMAILNMLEEDIKIISRFESTETNSTIISAKRQEKNILQSFNDLFYGQIQSRICCRTCGYNTSTFEKFTCLSLPLCSKNGEDIKNPTVEACLKNYFIQETLPLTYGWKCDKCKEVREALKDQIVEKLPIVLMLHLLRNSANGTKINTFVNYPVHKLRYNFPFSLDVVKKLPNSLEFNLNSVVHHHGETIRSGHYTANGKRPLGGKPLKLEWVAFDDRRAEKMRNLDDVVKYTGYLLFYYSKSEN